MIRFIIERGDEHLASHSGLGLVGALLDKSRLKERLSELSLEGVKKPEITHFDNAAAMIGLLCMGKPDYDAVEPMREESFFAMSLGLGKTPSSSTLRQRLEMGAGAFDPIVVEESAKLIRAAGARISPCHEKLVALDVDVSPLDNSHTKKEGVSYTYKGYDGYAPIFAYLGGEGYMINCELREGKQHCQKGTEDFLRETFALSRLATDAKLLVRLDGGNDDVDNVAECMKAGAHWLIKRNLRREDPEEWLLLAITQGRKTTPREGKHTWYGDTWVEIAGFDEPLRIAYKVTKRDTDSRGQGLLLPESEIKVETWWTSLPDEAEKIVQLYHAHGTSEQFHSEVKSDMDLERLPSGKFAANALILKLGLMAYNVLRIIGQTGLELGFTPRRGKVQRRRLRSVIQDMIYVACRVVRHARRVKLSFGRHNAWYPVWKAMYLKFAG